MISCHDKNVWYKNIWKRGNYITLAFILIMLEVFLVVFSYTDVFSNYMYYFIVTMKLLGIACESIIEPKLQDKMMLSGISSTIGVVENLVTFGANDFQEFLVSWIIGLGMQYVERFYLPYWADKVVSTITEAYDSAENFMIQIFNKGDDDSDEENENKDKKNDDKSDNGNGSKESKEKEAEKSLSDILLTEEGYNLDPYFVKKRDPKDLHEFNKKSKKKTKFFKDDYEKSPLVKKTNAKINLAQEKKAHSLEILNIKIY